MELTIFRIHTQAPMRKNPHQHDRRSNNKNIIIQDEESLTIGSSKSKSTSIDNRPTDNNQRLRVTREKNKKSYFQSLVRTVDVNQIEEIDADDEVAELDQGQVEKLAEVIRNLAIKNKLNSKNAFQVPLIDVNQLGAIKKNDQSSWNKIANVLQNSSKIYGYRVDFMADSINKMTSNIARNQKTQQIRAIQKERNSKQFSIDLQDTTCQTNSNKKWEEEVYDRHLQKDKINMKIVQESKNTCHQQIRRMFDQNGLAGLLLARLPISSSLNVTIGSGIQYKKKNLMEIDHFSKHQNFSRGFNMQILTQIANFRDYCLKKDSNNRQSILSEQLSQQIYGEPENFLHEEHTHELNQFYFQQMEDQNELETLYNNISKQKINTQSLSLTTQSYFAELSMFAEPFEQIIPCNKRQRKDKKQGVKKSKAKRRAKKKQEINIDFASELQSDKSTILSVKDKSLALNQNKARNKEKHLIKTMVPEFNIQQPANYQPILEQNQLIDQQGTRFMDQELKKGEFSPPNLFSEALTSQFLSTQRGVLAMPNIKSTKAWLWDNIKSNDYHLLSKLHSKYQSQKGPVSEVIIFLAILHLGNQQGLVINEGLNFQIQIVNPNFQSS